MIVESDPSIPSSSLSLSKPTGKFATRLGIIQEWTIRLDAAILGFGILAFIGITASKPCSELIDALKSISAIEECHSVAAGLSLLLKVRVRDTASLLMLSERLHKVPGIERAETTIVLRSQIERPISLKELVEAIKKGDLTVERYAKSS